MRFFRSVVNQFVFAGVVLFCLNLWLFPEPKPQLGPPNPERVQLQAEALQQLQQTQLTEQQIERIKRRELREELLFVEAVERGVIDQDLVVQRRLIRNMRFMSPEREATDEALLSEAWELRLHLADEVVRRRTVQVMETLIVATQPPYTPTDAELLDEYNSRLSEFEEPARLSFAHVFLRPDSTGERAATLVKAIRAGATPDELRELGRWKSDCYARYIEGVSSAQRTRAAGVLNGRPHVPASGAGGDVGTARASAGR